MTRIAALTALVQAVKKTAYPNALIVEMRNALEAIAPAEWPYRCNYVSSKGYVVWRDVYGGQRVCTLEDAIETHRSAVFVCESDAVEYCEYMNGYCGSAKYSRYHAPDATATPPAWMDERALKIVRECIKDDECQNRSRLQSAIVDAMLAAAATPQR